MPVVTPWQIGVVILLAGDLWLKGRPTTTETEAASSPALATPTGEGAAAAPESVVVGPATAEAPVSTSAPEDLEPRPGESPEAHLDRLLEEGQPIFAFFHSNTCYQCIEMDKSVQEVYPDFAGQVALVDVNVYDEANGPLLQRAEIRVIPTLIFIDRTGQGTGATGVMPAEQLQEALTSLAAGGTP
ncbi:MAG: thioredoxin fold domain-containing protein [Anaerolineae bacterium]